MFRYYLLLTAILNSVTVFCQKKQDVITIDIENFWIAYDKITSTTDSTAQYNYLNSLYLNKATAGLTSLCKSRNYTPQSYIKAINNYPLFWKSVRKNTTLYKKLLPEIKEQINRFKKLYPDAQTATIYYCIGALRTGGTAIDNKVIIGSELAFADKKTVVTEFPDETQKNFRSYFDSYSDSNIILLNVHEYVHTQQKEMIHNLLSQSIYEGVAEFISVLSTGISSATPAVSYGKKNENAVKAIFEKEMFNPYMQGKWLWSNQANEFGTRDLGYYIGYELCERNYNNAKDKKKVIKYMIELDYTNEKQIEKFVDDTHFFSQPITGLFAQYQSSRPVVIDVKGIVNGNENNVVGTKTITITFTEPMDINYRNFDYGPLGENALLSVKSVRGFSEDGKSITIEVDLMPNRHYQLLIGNGFRTKNGIPLMPYLIDFKTLDK